MHQLGLWAAALLFIGCVSEVTLGRELFQAPPAAGTCTTLDDFLSSNDYDWLLSPVPGAGSNFTLLLPVPPPGVSLDELERWLPKRDGNNLLINAAYLTPQELAAAGVVQTAGGSKVNITAGSGGLLAANWVGTAFNGSIVPVAVPVEQGVVYVLRVVSPVCKRERTPCRKSNTTQECCEGLVCEVTLGDPRNTNCLRKCELLGATCATDGDCCTQDLVCNRNTSTCVPRCTKNWLPCVSSRECCSLSCNSTIDAATNSTIPGVCQCSELGKFCYAGMIDGSSGPVFDSCCGSDQSQSQTAPFCAPFNAPPQYGPAFGTYTCRTIESDNNPP